MDTVIKISPNKEQLARELAEEVAAIISKASFSQREITIALPGGSTPGQFFSSLAADYGEKLNWELVHFFWGDERCVPPHDPESNYGMTNRMLFEKIVIPVNNIHRVAGEDDPEAEAVRYSREILKFTRQRHGLPVFELIILGLGDDGHTASIFPGQKHLLTSDSICSVASHPVTGQKRITLTGQVINNADNVIFLVCGAGKAEIVADIIEKPGAVDYPAAFIEPRSGVLKWYLDIDAASMLGQWA
jgi:6-phosphogluconolactonase